MDRPPPELRVPAGSTPRPVAVLACESEKYFGPVLRELGVQPVALTRSFMAPEAYLIEALAASVAKHGPTAPVPLRTALVDAYARYQRIAPRAAGAVFSKLGPVQVVAPPQFEPGSIELPNP